MTLSKRDVHMMGTRWPGWQRENFAAKEPHREQFGVMKLP